MILTHTEHPRLVEWVNSPARLAHLQTPARLAEIGMSLGPDVNRHGVHTIPKGECAGCGQPIIGEIIIAMGKNWHPEHYTCCQCGVQLGRVPFYERGGKAYCERDYHDLYLPKCAVCDGAINKKCVYALGKAFHVEHFKCSECGNEIGVQGFYEKDGLAYCRADYIRLFGPKCHGCGYPVQRRFVSALGKFWDTDCFVCADCGSPFQNGTFFDWDGEALCERDFHRRRGTVCAECQQPINGRCVVAMGKPFHPEHFQCVNCRKQLTRANFKEYKAGSYCQRCYHKVEPPIEYVTQ